MSLVIGLTGGIASGKSTVARMLIDKKITVIDADVIAKQAVEKGKPAYGQIVEAFGKEILLENGGIDRKKLGAIVFTDEQKRLTLNQIVHPAVRAEMMKQRDEAVARKEQFVVLDIPLLYESGLDYLVGKVLVVTVPADIQLKRLMERNSLTEEEAMSRITSQMPLADKTKKLTPSLITAAVLNIQSISWRKY